MEKIEIELLIEDVRVNGMDPKKASLLVCSRLSEAAMTATGEYDPDEEEADDKPADYSQMGAEGDENDGLEYESVSREFKDLRREYLALTGKSDGATKSAEELIAWSGEMEELSRRMEGILNTHPRYFEDNETDAGEIKHMMQKLKQGYSDALIMVKELKDKAKVQEQPSATDIAAPSLLASTLKDTEDFLNRSTPGETKADLEDYNTKLTTLLRATNDILDKNKAYFEMHPVERLPLISNRTKLISYQHTVANKINRLSAKQSHDPDAELQHPHETKVHKDDEASKTVGQVKRKQNQENKNNEAQRKIRLSDLTAWYHKKKEVLASTAYVGRLKGMSRGDNMKYIAGIAAGLVSAVAVKYSIDWVRNRHVRMVGVLATNRAIFLADQQGIQVDQKILEKAFKGMMRDGVIRNRLKKYLATGKAIGQQRRAMQLSSEFIASELLRYMKRVGAMPVPPSFNAPPSADSPSVRGYIHPPGYAEPVGIPGIDDTDFEFHGEENQWA